MKAITAAQLEAASRHRDEQRAMTIAQMVDNMPTEIPERETIAAEAIRAFEGGIIKKLTTKAIDIESSAERRDMESLGEALNHLDETLENMSVIGQVYLASRLEQHGVDLDKMSEWLNFMQEIAATPPESRQRRGKPARDATTGVLYAADSLMGAGLSRKAAARVIETMMTECSKWLDSRILTMKSGTIEQTIIRRGPLTKGRRKTHIWLTPVR